MTVHRVISCMWQARLGQLFSFSSGFVRCCQFGSGGYVGISWGHRGVAVSSRSALHASDLSLQFPEGGIGCQLGHLLMVMLLDFPCPLAQRASMLFVLY